MLDYQSAGSLATNFSQPWRRHRYNFDPVNNVTGVRLLVPGTGIGPGGTAIDEIELYEMAGPFVPPPPPPPNLVLTPAAGFAIGFNGNNGLHSTPDNPAPVPNNLALATKAASRSRRAILAPSLEFHFTSPRISTTASTATPRVGSAATPSFPARLPESPSTDRSL